jgi:hypothetical protein
MESTIVPTPIEAVSLDVSTPLSVKLILSKLPLVGESVELRTVIETVTEAPGTVARIDLPSGVRLIRGDLFWEGDLKPNNPVIIQSTIQFEEEGQWKLEARALCPLNDGDSWGALAVIYLSISKDQSYIGFPTETPSGHQENFPTPQPVDPIP